MNFYHAIYSQITTCFKQKFFVHKPGITVDFGGLSSYNTVKVFLLDLAKKTSFGLPEFNELWYLKNYNRSIQPITLYPQLLEMFQLIYFKMQHLGAKCEYNDFFNEHESCKFQNVIDNWAGLHK
jgi:hypothetical protein